MQRGVRLLCILMRKHILRGEYCDAEGCTIKDQITTKITVDLGGHPEETGSGDLDGQAIAEAATRAQ